MKSESEQSADYIATLDARTSALRERLLSLLEDRSELRAVYEIMETIEQKHVRLLQRLVEVKADRDIQNMMSIEVYMISVGFNQMAKWLEQTAGEWSNCDED